MRVKVCTLILFSIFNFGFTSMSAFKIFNVVESIVSEEIVTISSLGELLGVKLLECNSVNNVFPESGYCHQYESVDKVNADFKYQVRLGGGPHPDGVFLMILGGGAVSQSEILRYIGNVKYVVTPSIEMGVETISYKTNGKEVFFEFDSESENLKYVSVHF